MNGIELIAAERKRQIEEEGWTPEHDAEHDKAELTMAARAYAGSVVNQVIGPPEVTMLPVAWPWDAAWWKPSDDPIRNLEKAGALIAAEIDRLSSPS